MNCIHAVNEAVILGFFHELSKSFAPNLLWTKFSMLREELEVKKMIKSTKKFVHLQQYLKQLGRGYQPKKSKLLTRQQVLKFLCESDETYLMVKVAISMGAVGACRSDLLMFET